MEIINYKINKIEDINFNDMINYSELDEEKLINSFYEIKDDV